ncbi:hypothetical protein GQ457_13G018760 [Hibiscus cannabinus]
MGMEYSSEKGPIRLGDSGTWSKLWNVQVVVPGILRDLIQMWENVYVKESAKLVWRISFFEIVWSIWLCQNKIVFQEKLWDFESLMDMILLRLGFLSQALVSSNIIRRPLCGSWSAPPMGWLKFNVNASVCGGFSEAGIGGILRNHGGNILVFFSGSGGISDPTGVELATILKEYHIFRNLQLSESHKLMVEFDSLLVVRWINDLSCAPTFFTELVNECRAFCVENGWTIGFVFRESNDIAYQLARKRIGRNQLLLWQDLYDSIECGISRMLHEN